MSRHTGTIVFAFALSAAVALGWLTARAQNTRSDKPDTRVFELRTYITEEGRLPALNARFRDHTNKLFQKHGMTVIGYWTPTDPKSRDNTLIYVLAFPSAEARDRAWKDFGADAEWKAAREASEKDGKIVARVESRMLVPTDYSPLK